MTTDILAAIDGALADNAISPDAMRWNPALSDARGESAPGTGGIRPFSPSARSAIGGNPEASAAALRAINEAFAAAGRAIQPVFVQAQATFAAFAEAFKPVMKTLGRAAHDLDATRHPRQHIRCATCHPHACPGRLAIDGHEYARRRNARRRRGN